MRSQDLERALLVALRASSLPLTLTAGVPLLADSTHRYYEQHDAGCDDAPQNEYRQ